MKLVFALKKYFPYGGLQKDMLAIALECASRGHQVEIFCQSWSGGLPDHKNIRLNILTDELHWWQSNSNHSSNQRFSRDFQQSLKNVRADLVIGFNKMGCLNFYYAADTCFKAKLFEERPWPYRFLPRYRYFLEEESAVFGAGSQTRILAISQKSVNEYQRYYQTPNDRFILLPPGIAQDRVNTKGERLFVLHKELGLGTEQKILLMVGSGFQTKGLDRAISALSALPPDTHLVVVGSDKPTSYQALACDRKVENRIHFLGGRSDVPGLMKSADLLIHPARRENTGTVLLEAAVAGLPVIATDVCGYAHYINENSLGYVLPSPFNQDQLNNVLMEVLADREQQKRWRENGLAFGKKADIFSMAQKAADHIEQLADQKSEKRAK